MLGPVLDFYLSSCYTCMLFQGNFTQTLNFESQLYSDDSQKHLTGPEFYSKCQTLILIKLSLSSKLLWPKLKSNPFSLFKTCYSPYTPISSTYMPNPEIRVIQIMLTHHILIPILTICQVGLIFSNFITCDSAQFLVCLSSGLLIYYTISF